MGSLTCAFKFVGNTGIEQKQKVTIDLKRNEETGEYYGDITMYDRFTNAKISINPFSIESEPEAIKLFLSGLL